MKGIFKNGNKAYHEGVGLSSSDMKEILRSPAHYLAYKSNPEEPTPAMIRGTLIHALILEPETFESEFAVGTGFKYRTGKEYQKCVEANPGKTIITQEELTNARLIVNAFTDNVSKNPELAKLMEGHKELSFYWEDKTTGVLCKARPDIVTPHGVIVDIKTSADAGFDNFQKQLVDFGYFISAALYLRAVLETSPGNKMIEVIPTSFTFVVIETVEPYAVAIYTLEPAAIATGLEQVDKALERYAQAVAEDKWVGYSKQAIPIGIPNWYFFKMSYKGGEK